METMGDKHPTFKVIAFACVTCVETMTMVFKSDARTFPYSGFLLASGLLMDVIQIKDGIINANFPMTLMEKIAGLPTLNLDKNMSEEESKCHECLDCPKYGCFFRDRPVN